MQEQLSELEKYEFFKKHRLTTKEEVLASLQRRMAKYRAAAEQDKLLPGAFYTMLLHDIDLFYRLVENTVLFEKLPTWWVYSYDISYDAIVLSVQHAKSVEVNSQGEVDNWVQDSEFKLVGFRPKQLTVSEYAAVYSVEQGTIRQWIRRGKIRTAVKYGNEWRIPEITPPPSRGYTPAQYKWDGDLDGLPEEYAYLNDYRLATFYQDQTDKNQFHIMLTAKEAFKQGDSRKNRKIDCDIKEREKLELIMIANPQIRYCDSF